ncbi:MAG: hypothetical protein ABC585_03460 [Candidatus Methanosuratincola petrocarbonis]
MILQIDSKCLAPQVPEKEMAAQKQKIFERRKQIGRGNGIRSCLLKSF